MSMLINRLLSISYYWLPRYKHIRQLLKHNKKFWQKTGAFQSEGNRVIIAEHALGANFWSLIISISAAIVASALGAKVVFLMKGRFSAKKAWPRVVQKSFVNCDFVYIDDVFDQKREYIISEARKIFKTIKSPQHFLDISYKGIPIGEQVYDSVMKYKHATIWRVDEKMVAQLENAIKCVEAVHTVMAKHNVIAGVFTHTTCDYHGVAVRTILQNNTPVFQAFGGLHAIYKYNRMVNSRGHLDIHIKIPFKRFQSILASHKVALLSEADAYFKKRFGGEINDWDAMRAFSPEKKLYKTRKDFFQDYPGLNPNNKNVFIMLHAMNDDPHVQIQHLFKDYYDWFATTLKSARSKKNVNWIFKQHPMIKFYPDDANLFGLFDLIKEEDHIIYIDETVPFNQASVPVLADVIITCAGTAGLEFSAFGIPAIIAANNSYSGYGICKEPLNIDGYLQMLNQIENIQPLGQDVIENAKLLFYLMYNKLIPSFQTGFFPYMNHDQMKALTEDEAVKTYLTSLNADTLTLIDDMKKFVRSDENADATDLFIRLYS
jgi:hypothetical protein